MTLDALWFSQQGKYTSDNRDCYGIAERGGDRLFIVADGSTSSPRGGELASALIATILNEFMGGDGPVNQCALRYFIAQAHAVLKRVFPADAASYLIAAYTSTGQLHTLHAGDCRLGRVQKSGQTQWLTPVHTLATALGSLPEEELIRHADRHILTRCFRGKRLAQAEYHCYSLYADDELVIATDGFWAEASLSHQLEILNGGSLSGNSYLDDISCLSLKRVKD